jgi:endothelin-converting enzyme
MEEVDKLAPTIQPSRLIQYLLPATTKLPSKVILHNVEYFDKLDKLVKGTPPEILQAYFISLTILAYASFLDEKFQAPMRRLQSTLEGTDKHIKTERWETCLKVIDELMGHMAGRYFVFKAFGGRILLICCTSLIFTLPIALVTIYIAGDSKIVADELITAIKDSFVDILPDLDWLDNETRIKAIEKVWIMVKNMLVICGVP